MSDEQVISPEQEAKDLISKFVGKSTIFNAAVIAAIGQLYLVYHNYTTTGMLDFTEANLISTATAALTVFIAIKRVIGENPKLHFLNK